MRLSYDPAKNERNIRERGLSFELVGELDWVTAIAMEDTRREYGEKRIRILALLLRRLYVAVVTIRGDTTHVISLRKANDREIKHYEQLQS